MYYKARDAALKNKHMFHVAAVLKRGKSVIRIGVNSWTPHPKFHRRYENGTIGMHLHAEMDVLRFSKPGDQIHVYRFLVNGELSMAKPCKHCERFIKEHKISVVYYSDWNGNINKWKVRS